jgi:hypothetical protein
MQIGFAHASDSGQITFVKDGDAGADVFCSVTPSGNGFQAQGALEVGADVFEYKVNLAATNDEANKATGSVSYRTVSTVSKYTSPPETPCNFWVTPSQEVAAGRIWAQFECPQILNLSAGRGCAIGSSTIAMQNCDQ